MTKEELLLAADKLDEAREKMNNGGKHWIRGYLRRVVLKGHKPGGRGLASKKEALKYHGVKPKECEYGFCSVGGLNAVKAPTLSYKALADTINSKGRHLGKGSANNSIITWNDAYERKWGDVSRAFRKAARNLRKQAADL